MRNYVTTYDPFFDLFFHTSERNNHNYIMNTDVLDKKDKYELRVNVGNVKKENIKLSLENGYLTVNVTTSNDYDENEEYIFRERTSSEYERSYYVGENVKLADLSASLEDGILSLRINKPKEVKEEVSYFIWCLWNNLKNIYNFWFRRKLNFGVFEKSNTKKEVLNNEKKIFEIFKC